MATGRTDITLDAGGYDGPPLEVFPRGPTLEGFRDRGEQWLVAEFDDDTRVRLIQASGRSDRYYALPPYQARNAVLLTPEAGRSYQRVAFVNFFGPTVLYRTYVDRDGQLVADVTWFGQGVPASIYAKAL